MDRAYELRRRYAAVNIAVGLVGSFFIGRKGGDASGICCLSAITLFHLGISQASLALRSTFTTPNDGVEVESRSGLTIGVITEVGEVESRITLISADAGHELTDFSLELHGVDVDDIVGTGVTGAHARCKTQLDMESVNTALGEVHPADRTGREEQTRIVNVNDAIFIDEALLIETGELVILNMSVAMGLTGESTLDGGTEERGGVLHGLEKSTLAQLRLRLAVVDLRRTATTEGLAEAGVEDTVADGAGLLYDGWFYLCHCFYCLNA